MKFKTENTRLPIYSISGSNVLFVHIPKTGGMAVSHVLETAGEARFDGFIKQGLRNFRPRHADAKVIEKFFFPDMFDAAVVVVRHPVDKLLSEFRYQQRKPGIRTSKVLGFDRWLKFSLARYRLDPDYRDNHFRPQVEFLPFDCKPFRYEDGLDRPLAYLESVTGAQLVSRLEPRNVSPRVEARPSEKSIALIREVYADDFRAFGYDTD